jgi:hypothetical protein
MRESTTLTASSVGFLVTRGDRLIIARYHFFRAQFANSFPSPPEQDYAAYCACLEAVLEVDKSTDQMLGKALRERLAELFLGLTGFDEWAKGLYDARSFFNHGLSPPATAEGREQRKELIAFRERPHNGELLRRICLGAIHHKASCRGRPHGAWLLVPQGQGGARALQCLPVTADLEGSGAALRAQGIGTPHTRLRGRRA